MYRSLINRILRLESITLDRWRSKAVDIINSTNQMNDDYHVGIRTVNDVLTLEEAFDSEPPTNPDVSDDYIQSCIESGKIRIYSSKRIISGTFVTPSRMMAKDYAGSSNIFSKIISINSVAWINSDEGVYIGNIKWLIILCL